jgi:site-specific DNA recombinase
MYVDKLDGRIKRSLYAQLSEQWQSEQDKLMPDILRHRAADRSISTRACA